MALVDDAQFRSARASLEAVFSSMVTRYMAAEESDVEAFVAQDASALAEGLKGLTPTWASFSNSSAESTAARRSASSPTIPSSRR